MSEDRMESVSEIAELAHLPENDPRMVAAMRSPRARALLARYREFLAEPQILPGADFEAADARLAAAIDHELGTCSSASSRTTSRAAAPGESWIQRLFAPAMRPALAFAALVVVAGAVWLAVRPGSGPATNPPVMRGDSSNGLVARIEAAAPGSVKLSWNAVEGADHYELRFFGTDLGERGRVNLGAETRVELLAGQLPVGLASGEVLLWQAVALHGNDVLMESPTASIRLP